MAKQRVPITLARLVDAMELSSPEFEQYLDLETGEILMYAYEHSDFADDDDRFEDRFIRIPYVDSSEGYADMQAFIESLPNDHLQEVLAVAIQGEGAFRRFKDALLHYPEQREEWFAFKADQAQARLLAWLAANNLEIDW